MASTEKEVKETGDAEAKVTTAAADVIESTSEAAPATADAAGEKGVTASSMTTTSTSGRKKVHQVKGEVSSGFKPFIIETFTLIKSYEVLRF